MSGSPRVLVVEDDADIAGVLRRSLDKEGYEVRVAGDGEAALEESGVFEPDAVVLDLGLPKMDGVEVCRRLREEGDVPILMLTARDAVDARVEGLDSGADDYLVKPFERDELLARVRALLRRRPPRGSAFLVVGRPPPQPRHAVRSSAASRALELTAREFELLEHLMRNERIVVSRQALLDEVWGYHPFAETNTVDVFISNLRRKLEAGGEPRLLHTVRGAGYVLRERMRTRLPVELQGGGGERRADLRDPVPLRRGDRRRGRAAHPRGLRRRAARERVATPGPHHRQETRRRHPAAASPTRKLRGSPPVRDRARGRTSSGGVGQARRRVEPGPPIGSRGSPTSATCACVPRARGAWRAAAEALRPLPRQVAQPVGYVQYAQAGGQRRDAP